MKETTAIQVCLSCKGLLVANCRISDLYEVSFNHRLSVCTPCLLKFSPSIREEAYSLIGEEPCLNCPSYAKCLTLPLTFQGA